MVVSLCTHLISLSTSSSEYYCRMRSRRRSSSSSRFGLVHFLKINAPTMSDEKQLNENCQRHKPTFSQRIAEANSVNVLMCRCAARNKQAKSGILSFRNLKDFVSWLTRRYSPIYSGNSDGDIDTASPPLTDERDVEGDVICPATTDVLQPMPPAFTMKLDARLRRRSLFELLPRCVSAADTFAAMAAVVVRTTRSTAPTCSAEKRCSRAAHRVAV